jgi:hypothetical protein
MEGVMSDKMNQKNVPDKKLAAVCGLFCAGCSLYIATTEDPVRLKHLAKQFSMTEDDVKCFGCHSDKRGPYCQTCTMIVCAHGKGIEFCGECAEYPCDTLKEFQKAMPHRIELFDDLERIRLIGWDDWSREKTVEYGCPQCHTINSAYDVACRACGNNPGNEYVRRHHDAVLSYLASRG